jgi:hypothetical protein
VHQQEELNMNADYNQEMPEVIPLEDELLQQTQNIALGEEAGATLRKTKKLLKKKKKKKKRIDGD